MAGSFFALHFTVSLLLIFVDESSLSFNASRQQQNHTNIRTQANNTNTFHVYTNFVRSLIVQKSLSLRKNEHNEHCPKMMAKEAKIRKTIHFDAVICHIITRIERQRSPFLNLHTECECVDVGVVGVFQCTELSVLRADSLSVATISEQVDNQARRINIKTALMTFIMLLNI